MTRSLSLTSQLCAIALLACSYGPQCIAEDALEFTLPCAEGRPQSVAFDSKLSQLAVLQPSGDVAFYDLHSGAKVREWKTGWERDAAMDTVPLKFHRLGFLESTQQLLVASGDHIGVFDAADGKRVRELVVPGGGVGNLFISKDCRWVVAQCSSAMIAWNLETGAPLFTHQSSGIPAPHRASDTALKLGLGDVGKSMPSSSQMAFSEDGSMVALGLGFESIDLWALEGPTHLGFRKGSSAFALSSSSTATTVAFLPDGRLLGVFSHLNLEVFSAEKQRGKKVINQIQSKEAEVFEIHALGVATGGQKIALGGIGVRSRKGLDPTVTVFDQPTVSEVQVLETTGFKPVARFQGGTNECVSTVVWDASAERLATVSGVGYTELWTGTLQQSLHRKGGMMKSSTLPLRVRVWTP